MFSLKVIDTDEFMDMPQSTQLLYYHLAMRADDDGFVGNPKRIMRMTGCSDDDMKILIAKKFIIPFESGICVIRHWRIHNLIRQDRYTETEYKEEKKKLLENNGKYEYKDNALLNGNHLSYQRLPQVRLGKVRLGKDNKTNSVFKKTLLKRKDFKVKPDIYKEITDAYQQYKGIKLSGAEFGEVKRAIKTMIYSGRTKENIIDFMKWTSEVCQHLKEGNQEYKNFEWLENWTILTIKRKMPEFLAGKLKVAGTEDIIIPSYAKEYQKNEFRKN